MHDKSSFPFHLIETERSRMMPPDVATDMRAIALAFMGTRRPGESVKVWLNRGWEAAWRPPFWRFRAAFHGEAGCWSAQAVADFQQRYRRLVAAQRRQVEHEAAKAALISGTSLPSNTLEAARDELRLLRTRIDALESALRLRS